MITIQQGVRARPWDIPERRWVAWCYVNCHGIQSFVALYPGPTRHYVRGARTFLRRMAGLTAERWELDNYPCH